MKVIVSQQVIKAALVLFFHVAAAVAGAQENDAGYSYRLGAGDKLEIKVFNQDDLTGQYTITGSGQISMPLIGSVKAEGLTVKELEIEVADKLKPDYLLNPRINIQVLNYRPFYILGEVQSPASYPYVSGMTYLNAVAIAGGYTYRAKEGYAYVIRGDDPRREEIKVKMDMFVQPGDIIRIDERLF
ncbi:MAG: polysaccharide biosynthesis/export family protein [Gammaproteobacteria bacterium]